MAKPAKRVPNHTASESKSKIAERLAFDPFLPKEDLLNELIRNMVNPDSDIGQSYYVGVVTSVVKKDDPEIDVRDVFYSLSDNSERVTKDVSDKKYNSERVVLFVHIPSFITSDRVETNPLNYYNFSKIRVEYNAEGKKVPKPGNIVKLQFKNKNSFYNPYVLEIEDVGIEYTDVNNQKKQAKDLFDQYLNCKILNVQFPKSADQVTYNQSTKPVGGYVEAIKEIERIFTPGFISSFISTLKESEYGSLKDAKVELKTLSVYENVYEKFKNKIQFKYLPDAKLESYTNDIEKNTYLILATDVRISLKDDTNNTKFKNAFYDYLKKEFQSRLGYTFIYNQNAGDTTFKLNLNLNLLFNSTTQKVEDYIKISENIDSNTTYYTKVLPANSPPQTVETNKTPDKCDSIVASPKGLYKSVYGPNKTGGKLEFDKDHNTADNNIVKLFYEDAINPDDFLKTDYYKQLIGLQNKSLTDLTKINKNFYELNGETIDSYGLKTNKANVVYMETIYLPQITNFLKTLREKIAKNELLINNDIKNILIIPRQVIKIKKGPVGKKQDPNSRHFYGRAVDIAVYLKITENNVKRIVQIKPEIIALYAEKSKGNSVLGHGLFLNQINKYYNHIEFIKGTFIYENNISKELTTEDRFFTGGETDLEKELDKSNNKLERLKQEIQNGIDYKNPITGELDVRFGALL